MTPDLATLNPELIDPRCRDQARRAFLARDATGFLFGASNEKAVSIVFDNLVPRRAAGMYEAALLRHERTMPAK